MTRLGARLALACTVVAACVHEQAKAAPPPPGELVSIRASLERGAFSEAIDRLELWSDQGVVHPDLSFDRGVAYLGRAESAASRPADLGQAAAAFEEALHLDPSDEEAKLALERIREVISERRVKQQGAGVVARPRLLRALLDLIGENVWAGLAGIGSLLLTVGLGARVLLRSHQVRLASGIAAVVGLLLMSLGGGMAAAGAYLRAHFSPAVVIVAEARLHDSAGRPFSGTRGPSALDEAGDRVPEGSLVHVAESRGSLVLVEWGDTEAWLNARELRRLAVAP